MSRRFFTTATFVLLTLLGQSVWASDYRASHQVVRDGDIWRVTTGIVTFAEPVPTRFSAPLPSGSKVINGSFIRDARGRIVGVDAEPWHRWELEIPAVGDALPGFLLEDLGPQRVTFTNGRFEPTPGSSLQKYPGYLANPNFEKKLRNEFDDLREPDGSTTMFLAPSDISAGVPGSWKSDSEARAQARFLFGGIAFALLALVGFALFATDRMAKREAAEAFLRDDDELRRFDQKLEAG
jgi:hypothetical protein